MEVFLHNVPRDWTDRALKLQLDPVLKNLGIRDFDVDKHRSKPYAQVTFLLESDAKRFLDNHGQVNEPCPLRTRHGNIPPSNLFSTARPQKHPRATSRLTLGKFNIFCKASDRPVDQEILKHLVFLAQRRLEKKEAHASEDKPICLSLYNLSCGHLHYQDPGGKLFFVSEREWLEAGTVKFSKREVIVRQPTREVRAPLNSIIELVWDERGNLMLQLATPPKIISTEAPVTDLMAMLQLIASPVNSLIRQWRLPAMDEQHKSLVQYCLVYHLSVHPADIGTAMRRLKQRSQLDRDIPIRRHDLPVCRPIDLDLLPFDEEVRKLKSDLSTIFDALPYCIKFELQALVYNGYLHPREVRHLAREIATLRRFGKVISLEAIKLLFTSLDYPSPDVDAHELSARGITEWLLEKEEDMKHGVDLRTEILDGSGTKARIYRLTVTPTRITMHGPEMESMNRVLRKYPGQEDNFIRVQFADEDGQDIYYNPKTSNDKIYQRFKGVMQSGFKIADRTFGFLGFSHSSLRAHSAWFVAPFTNSQGYHDNHTIVQSLGEFSDIMSPARQAARIGQAFSETPFAVPMHANGIIKENIPDVQANGRVFSDGVGTISEHAMYSIWNYIPQSKKAPTCFQVRYGGAKGMLTLDPRLTGSKIRLRPSMIKFESEDVLNLEVCDMASKPIPLMLNRQMIKILEDMGVDEKWFVDLQDKELARIREATRNNFNVSKLLKRENVGDSIRLPKFFRQIEGMEYRKDPFLRRAVEGVVLKVLRTLKHKARIPVEEGMTLFGVMDETGYLDEGEVYISYDTMGYYAPPPGKRKHVLVTRSPALHPGDIQVARSVEPPENHPLRELNNCIVFSSRGERDLPSQLSGGDLDGDIYNIIWDRKALHPQSGDKLRVFAPADYTRVTPLSLGRAVTKDDMANFFVDFMNTDHLGVIATRHMILADLRSAGTLDAACVELAAFHSTAVDFSKTGHPVDLKSLPKGSKVRPDFLAPGPLTRIYSKSEILMAGDPDISSDSGDEDDNDGRAKYKYYHSDKVLGKLYRSVDERKIWYEDIRNVPKGGASFWDEFLSMANQRVAEIDSNIRWATQMVNAEHIRQVYEDNLLATMWDFSEHPTLPMTELEVFVGSFISFKTGAPNPRQRDRGRKLRDEFDRIAGKTVSDMLDPLRMGAYAKVTDALELCLACVYVGGMKEGWEGKVRGRAGDGSLESFRVVAACALMRELDRWVDGGKIIGDDDGPTGTNGRRGDRGGSG